MTAIEQFKTDGKPHGADEVSEVGKNLMTVLSGQGEGVERDPGLLMTNEDVRRIYRYVRHGLGLPTDLQQIRQLLGDSGINIAGLEPEAIRSLYVDIQAHAASWSPLEDDMRAVGSDLYVFSGALIATTEAMIELITSLDAWRTLKPDALTPEQIDSLPPISLQDADRKQLPGLMGLVGELQRLIARHSASTRRVRDGVSVFKRRLRNELEPEVSRKITLAGSTETNVMILSLNRDIALLNSRIDEKVAEYEEYCNYKWVGWWWGPLGFAVSASIYGRKAAQALNEKNRLIYEKNERAEQLARFNVFTSELSAFETTMKDLKVRMEGASSSIGNIESLWTLLAELADSSLASLQTLEDAKILVLFVAQFRVLVSHWGDVKKQALDLLTAFNNVLEESRR